MLITQIYNKHLLLSYIFKTNLTKPVLFYPFLYSKRRRPFLFFPPFILKLLSIKFPLV